MRYAKIDSKLSRLQRLAESLKQSERIPLPPSHDAVDRAIAGFEMLEQLAGWSKNTAAQPIIDEHLTELRSGAVSEESAAELSCEAMKVALAWMYGYSQLTTIGGNSLVERFSDAY